MIASFPAEDAAPRGTALLCLVAGLCDTATGLLLITVPVHVLGLLGLGPLGADTAATGMLAADADLFASRFVGTFVTGVGLSYLLPFMLGPARRAARWRSVLETTALLRGLVALFLIASVLLGDRDTGWLTVAATDGLLAIVQVVWLLRWARQAATRAASTNGARS